MRLCDRKAQKASPVIACMVSQRTFLAFALIGVLLSTYGLWLHYAGGPSSICNVSETFNCDKVNKSAYAAVFGIPVALLGLLAYAAVFLLVLKRKAVQRLMSFTEKDFWQYLLGLLLVMLLFQSYLTYVEFSIIRAYCIICLGSQLAVLALAVLGARRYILVQ